MLFSFGGKGGRRDTKGKEEALSGKERYKNRLVVGVKITLLTDVECPVVMATKIRGFPS